MTQSSPSPMRPSGRPYRVVAHGLANFCRLLPGMLQSEGWEVLDRSGHRPRQVFELVKDLAQCDLAYTWGGRISMGKFLWVARLMGKEKIVMLWSGSDVLFARNELASGLRAPWITDRIHWAVSPWVAEEVRALGLACEHVHAYAIPQVANPKPLPKRFSVLLYVADAAKAELYGWDRMVEVAAKLPKVQFNLCGLPPGQNLIGPSNISIQHWTDDFAPVLEGSTVYYRPVRHDGLSFSVLEALAHGRHVLYSYPLTGCVHVASVPEACRQLELLLDMHESGMLRRNEEGRRYVAEHYAPDMVRSELLQRWEAIINSPA